jgi:hypothetical protein
MFAIARAPLLCFQMFSSYEYSNILAVYMLYYRCLQLRGLRCCASSCFLVMSIVVLIVLCCFTYLNEMFSRGIVSVCRHPVTVGTIMHHLQGFFGRATARLNAIERRQNILDGKLSSVLATVDANTETLSELKTLLQKFMSSVKALDIASPSESKSAVHHRSTAQFYNVEGLAVPLAGGNEHYTKAILQEEVELEEPVETSTDPIWTAKGGTIETLINISSPENRGDVDKSNAWPKVASRGKEGTIATDPIHFNDSGNEGKCEVDVDPYALPASPDRQQKPQSVAKMVSLL